MQSMTGMKEKKESVRNISDTYHSSTRWTLGKPGGWKRREDLPIRNSDYSPFTINFPMRFLFALSPMIQTIPIHKTYFHAFKICYFIGSLYAIPPKTLSPRIDLPQNTPNTNWSPQTTTAFSWKHRRIYETQSTHNSLVHREWTHFPKQFLFDTF